MVATLVSAAVADEIQVIPQETRIPRGQTRSFDFGTVPQKDTTVLLTVQARLDAAAFGGSMYFMKLALNGHVVQAAKSRTLSRLRNRPVVSPVAVNLPYSWFGNNAWRVLYAPDFEGALKQKFYVGNPYELVFDVTDLTNPVSENRLEITNLAQGNQATAAHTEADLVIRSLVIRTQPGASPTMGESQVDREIINCGTPGAGPEAYQGEVSPGGGIVLRIGQERFEFSSAISYPNAGLNRLIPAATPDTTGQKGWQVRAQGDRTGGQVTGEGPDYRLRRTVRFTLRRVEVADEITNLHPDRKLGLLVSHAVSLKDKTATVRLAGNPDPAINEYYSNGNPSVYAALPQANLGLGLLIEDDVFRNQATLFYDPAAPTTGFRTEMLCLPAGGSHTLRWALYPVASRDYYDFINLVRADWGANFTVEGAWTFFSPDSILKMPIEEVRRQFQRLGIRYACSYGGWVDHLHDRKHIGFGTGVMEPYWADYRRRLREAAARIREAAPGCRVLVYYDSQRDTSDGGPEPFRDSWLTSVRGDPLSTDWSGVYSRTWSMVATLTNRFGRAMLGVADAYLDEIKADGLYWDEMEATGYGVPLITYNQPDGHSCLLNKQTYTVEREIGITTLLGEAHRLAVIDRVRAKGGAVMGNGPNATRALLAKKVQRMIEIQHNETWCYEGHLETPLGYASSRTDFGNWIRALRMGMLLVGTRYSYEHEFSRFVFPFTPIELHSGYLLGRERIIAAHSGNYGWPGERCLVQVRHFNTQGKPTGKAFPTVIGQEARTAVELAEGEAVVLERLPVAVQPKADQARVDIVSYDANELRLRLAAPGGARLRVGSGALKIGPRQRFTLTLGDVTSTVTATPDAVVLMDLKPAAEPLGIGLRAQ